MKTSSPKRLFSAAALMVSLLVVVPFTASQSHAAWISQTEGDYTVYYWNSLTNPKFRYAAATNHQWWHWSSVGTSWYTVSAAWASDTFIGDGASHDLGNGFTYTYLTAYDSGWFVKGYAGRFTYAYTPGQWRNYSSFGGWQNLGNAGLSASFMGDGAYHSLGNGFTYCYLAGWDSAWFVKGYAGRFSYQYTPGQWKTYSSYGGWQNLGNAGLSASFMGDGASHTLGNAFTYSYLVSSDSGWFLKGSAGRFSYLYGPGQWRTYSTYGGWQNLGNAGLSVSFMGDGARHDLGNDFGFQYDVGTDLARWFGDRLGFYKFAYAYAAGQWYDRDKYGNQYALGAAGTSFGEFMGDGSAHVLDATWSYRFDGRAGYWQIGGLDRFSYEYDIAAWFDYPVWGSVYQLGASGRTAAFIGDGSSRTLGNGWWFAYDAGLDEAFWARSDTGPARFSYEYGDGQWYHHNALTRYELGMTGWAASDFIGRGQRFDITLLGGNPWWYAYDYGLDQGFWYRSNVAPARFSFAYGAEQWYHHDLAGGGYSLALDAPSLGSFAGDGNQHALTNDGNAWWYAYDYLQDSGKYTTQFSGALRFAYGYNAGQWYHYDQSIHAYALGAGGQSLASFMGRGSVRHDITNGGNPWWFCYSYAGDVGSWFRSSSGGNSRFSYNYGAGQWNQHDYSGAGYAIGPGNSSLAGFIGDGSTWDVTNGGDTWWFSYHYAGDRGYWYRSASGPMRFSYTYDDGQWYEHDFSGTGYAIGASNWSLADFIADGSLWEVTVGSEDWKYAYDYAADNALWYNPNSGSDLLRFSYAYAAGQWYHHDGAGDGYTLGGSGSTLAAFIGDGSPHTLGNGWWFAYDGELDEAAWARSDAGPTRFSYGYEDGQWYHHDAVGRVTLGPDNASGRFIGSGMRYDISLGGGDTWFYLYSYQEDKTYWARSYDETARFAYAYGGGQWYHRDFRGTYHELGSSGQEAEFRGDGASRSFAYGFDYGYDYLNDAGVWTIGGANRLQYDYGNGQWRFWERGSQWTSIGSAGRSALFLGDGEQHLVMDNALWDVKYDSSIHTLRLQKSILSNYVFIEYDFGAAAWFDSYSNGGIQERYKIERTDEVSPYNYYLLDCDTVTIRLTRRDYYVMELHMSATWLAIYRVLHSSQDRYIYSGFFYGTPDWWVNVDFGYGEEWVHYYAPSNAYRL